MFDFRASLSPAVLRDVLTMKMERSVAGTVRGHIPDPRVAQMIDHFTQYAGSAPDASPAVLCGIAAMQTNEGVWYPRGGTGAVPKALARLAVEFGVETRTETSIRRIRVEGGAVRGVETERGEFVPLQAVISNSDSVRTHWELLTDVPNRVARRYERHEPACSGVVLYLGLKRRYEHLLHHNFVFSRSPE